MHPSHKRLAKNTLLMYLRMVVVTIITLYTSRLLLEALGIANFGIYNAIGGVIILISFLNSGLSIITQRNITYELGNKGGDVSLIFSLSIRVHLAIIAVVFIVAETLGLWFINHHMNFPEGEKMCINAVYQFSIFSALINIFRVPYSALILSHERMSFYAYNSVLEAILKIVCVYVIIAANREELIIYAALILITNTIISLSQIIYCKHSFKEIRYTKRKDNARLRQILSLSGWTFFSSFASIGCQQGDNIIINIFYGVMYNASVGIASQVNNALIQLVSGFQQALNPQLVKAEASESYDSKISLIYLSSRLSFFIMFTLAVPVLINLENILALWLTHVPPQTQIICTFIVIGALIETISGPLWMSIYATGNIKAYQICISILFLLELPCAYCIGRTGMPIYYIFVVRIIQYILLLITRIVFLHNLIGLKITDFVKNVILPILTTSLIIFGLILITQQLPPFGNSAYATIGNGLVWLIICALLSWHCGIDKYQRKGILLKIKKTFIHNHN